MSRLASVSYLVRDYDEAIRFFTRALRFTLVRDEARGDGRRWVEVAAPGPAGCTLILAKAKNDRERAAVGNQGGGRVWLFLHTDDFARDREVMLRQGVRFLEEPRHEPYGTVAVFEDLYGNRWDLLMPAAEA